MKLLKLIANLGYGSRKEVTAMFRDGRIADVDGRVLSSDDVVDPEQLRIAARPRSRPSADWIAIRRACC